MAALTGMPNTRIKAIAGIKLAVEGFKARFGMVEMAHVVLRRILGTAMIQ
jgi:hypothetical protein